MNKSIKIILFAILIVAIVGIIVFLMGNDSQPQGTNQQQNTNTQNNNQENTETISVSDLATHDSQEDCWIAFEGKVYDITDWLPKHPGSA